LDATISNWDLYRLFFEVAEAGSVTRAAAHLNISQPTLSRRISELENHLGVPLLYRTPTGVTLTTEGERLYRAGSKILRSVDEFERDFRLEIGDRAALVKISASEGMTRYWLLPRLRRFMNQHRETRFEVTSTIETLSLSDNDLDFVIRIGDPKDSELVGRKVGRLAFGLFASRDYLADRKPIEQRSDLDVDDVVRRDNKIPPLHEEQAELLSALSKLSASGLAPRLRIEPVATHYVAASLGLGVAFMPIAFATADGLIEVLPGEAQFILDIWLLRRRETALRKPHRDFSRFLSRELASSRGWFAGEAKAVISPK
jgi:DNA-binding transcriptional LysR family regulator